MPQSQKPGMTRTFVRGTRSTATRANGTRQADRRRRDLDNLLAASKSALDAVAAALAMDDREFEPVTLRRGDVCKAGMLVVEVGA